MSKPFENLMKTAQGKELSDFLVKKIKELDSAITMEMDPMKIAVEIKGRELAIFKLKDVLDELLIAKEELPTGYDKKEYAVDVD